MAGDGPPSASYRCQSGTPQRCSWARLCGSSAARWRAQWSTSYSTSTCAPVVPASPITCPCRWATVPQCDSATGVLLVGGRTTGGRIIGRMWWFRPETARFTAAGRLPTPLADAGALSAGNTAYLVGGERPAFSDRVLRLQWG